MISSYIWIKVLTTKKNRHDEGSYFFDTANGRHYSTVFDLRLNYCHHKVYKLK